MKGECVCGKVSYEVIENIFNLCQCHCSICQKQTGSSSQTGFFCQSENFSWLSGQDLISNFKKNQATVLAFAKIVALQFLIFFAPAINTGFQLAHLKA